VHRIGVFLLDLGAQLVGALVLDEFVDAERGGRDGKGDDRPSEDVGDRPGNADGAGNDRDEPRHQNHHHAHHDDKIKSFVYRSEKPFDPNRLEDFLGGILQIYGERLLRYKGVLYMKGVDRKVVFQGVHQMMGSDLAGKWMPIEKKNSKMVFIGIELPKDLITDGLDACLVK